eukprot:8848091-Pyramimonas_sp.AAC.1
MVDEVHWGDKCHSKAKTSAMPASNGAMSGSETIKDYVKDCRQKGNPIQNLRFYECRRPFRLGNGKL